MTWKKLDSKEGVQNVSLLLPSPESEAISVLRLIAVRQA